MSEISEELLKNLREKFKMFEVVLWHILLSDEMKKKMHFYPLTYLTSLQRKK